MMVCHIFGTVGDTAETACVKKATLTDSCFKSLSERRSIQFSDQ